MAQSALPFLKGIPVLVMRRGLFPNRQDIADVQSAWPNHIVRTETMYQPCRVTVTVQRRK